MIYKIYAGLFILCVAALPAHAVTLDVQIDSITGGGAATNSGFYSTTGADGTFLLDTTTLTPEPLLFFSFPGAVFNVSGVTAGDGNSYGYDSGTGVMRVAGSLAGLTGDFAFPGGRSFVFDIQLASGLTYTGSSDLPDFYQTATSVKGEVSAFFFQGPSDPVLAQNLTFSSPNPVPLPAGGLLLISALAMIGLTRRARSV